MSFQRNIEDFLCEHCGEFVKGDGYTNHCPKCLWSRHVDIEPGDRAAVCGALMKPVSIEGASPNYVLLHECVSCGFKRRNKVQARDNVEAVVALARERR